MNFLSHFSKVSRKINETNLSNNQKAWGELAPGLKYIKNQADLSILKYGQEKDSFSKKIAKGTPFNAAFNSCEIIAVQNALIALGKEKDCSNFPSLISHFEKKGAILKGYFGTCPKAILKYLKSKDIIVKKLKPIPENIGSTPVQILIYQNGKKLTSGIHTICIKKGNPPEFLNGRPSKDSVLLLLISLYSHTS